MSSNLKHKKIVCDTKKISQMVRCLGESVGDDLKFDMKNLKTRNSYGERIWDLLNTKLYYGMKSFNCIVDVTRFTSRDRVPVFDKDTGIIYIFMRETRFAELKRELEKGRRDNTHYNDSLAHIFNSDLNCSVEQTTLFSDPVSHSDEDIMYKKVGQILRDLKLSQDTISRYVTVLFNSSNYELNSVRAVMVDRQMDIIDEDNWNKYILKSESIIMDSVSNFSNESNNPSRGLELTKHGIARKKTKIETKEVYEEKKDNE